MEETKHKDVFNVTRQIQFPMKLFGDKGTELQQAPSR